MAVRRVSVQIVNWGVDEMGFHTFIYGTSSGATGHFISDSGSAGLHMGDTVTLVTNGEGKPVRVIKGGKDAKVKILLVGPTGYNNTTVVP